MLYRTTSHQPALPPHGDGRPRRRHPLPVEKAKMWEGLPRLHLHMAGHPTAGHEESQASRDWRIRYHTVHFVIPLLTLARLKLTLVHTQHLGLNCFFFPWKFFFCLSRRAGSSCSQASKIQFATSLPSAVSSKCRSNFSHEQWKTVTELGWGCTVHGQCFSRSVNMGKIPVCV